MTARAKAVAAAICGIVLLVCAAAWHRAWRARSKPRSVASKASSADSTPRGLVGYWVWRGWAEDDRMVQEISDDDLTPLVGPAFREGCPFEVACTRFGVHLLALGPSSELWLVLDATTSSDLQHVGRYRLAGSDAIVIERERYYSCAHPDVHDVTPTSFELRYRRVGEDVWIASAQAGWLDLGPAPAVPHHWIVFRRIERDDFLNRYLRRRCQDGGHPPRCDPGCASDRYGR